MRAATRATILLHAAVLSSLGPSAVQLSAAQVFEGIRRLLEQVLRHWRDSAPRRSSEHR